MKPDLETLKKDLEDITDRLFTLWITAADPEEAMITYNAMSFAAVARNNLLDLMVEEEE